MDTGCGDDIANIGDMTDSMKSSRHDAGDLALVFETANGETACNEMCDYFIKALKSCCAGMAYCMPDSPDVLSIGLRCVELGFGFWWEPYSETPALIPPGATLPKYDKTGAAGQWVWLETEDYIPYLVDKQNLRPKESVGKACPAPLARKLTKGTPTAPTAPHSDIQCGVCNSAEGNLTVAVSAVPAVPVGSPTRKLRKT
jgi:hypothetical protein